MFESVLFSAFGFCEYEEPEATLRCMRLLNEWKITDKTLVVSMNAVQREDVYDVHVSSIFCMLNS